MLVHTHHIEIEFGDCDPAGIVFYPNYFRFFDAATARLFEAALKMKKVDWTRRFGTVGIPMVDTGAKFFKPCRFGDEIRIESQIEAFGRTSFEVAHELYNGDELAVRAREKCVWVRRDADQPDKLRAVPLPQQVMDCLSV